MATTPKWTKSRERKEKCDLVPELYTNGVEVNEGWSFIAHFVALLPFATAMQDWHSEAPRVHVNQEPGT